MNRGALQSSPVHQMVGGSPIWWDSSNMSPLFPSSSQSTASSSSSSSVVPRCPQPSSTLQSAATCWNDGQELPESWSQLLLGGFVDEEERCSYTSLIQAKRMENWEDHQLMHPSASSHMANIVKNELYADRAGFLYGQEKHEEIQASAMTSSWTQILPNSSPRSSVTTSFNSSSSSMLDFSRNKAAAERKHRQLDHSSECNSTPTGSSYKKARVQASSAKSTFKVRKEKLGDRITALHQIVSPFGKTDTASVLLESIGYIRFLQSQIQALSSPYLVGGSGNNNTSHSSVQGERGCIFPEDPGQLLNDNSMKPNGPPDQDGDDEKTKDLRSRGLCLVPVSFIMHVDNDNAADYWAPTFGGGFQ